MWWYNLTISQTGCLITQLRKAQWIVGYWGYTWCTEAGISPVLGEAFEIRHALLSGYHRFSVEIPPDLLNAQMLCSEKSFLNLPYWRRTVALYHLGFGWKHGKWLRSPVSCFVCFGSVKLCDVWNARPFRLFHCIRVLACRLSLFTFFLHVSLCLKIVWRGTFGCPMYGCDWCCDAHKLQIHLTFSSSFALLLFLPESRRLHCLHTGRVRVTSFPPFPKVHTSTVSNYFSDFILAKNDS